MKARTKEPQYDVCIALAEEQGLGRLGLMSNQVWHDDPKRLAFVLARYKFVAKMFSGLHRVVEVGCGDAFASRIVRQDVGHLTVTDIDPVFIEDAKWRADATWPLEAVVHNMLDGPLPAAAEQPYDGAYSLDVLEHIEPADEDRFLGNIAASLGAHGALIVGMPSLNSQTYASPQSKAGHINCKHADDLKVVLERRFHNVFIFSMNDEVVHTGFAAMAHYYLALCCTKRAGEPGT